MAFDWNAYNQQYSREHYYRPSIYMPREYKDMLRQAAEEYTGGNVSQLVITAIDEFLESKGFQKK